MLEKRTFNIENEYKVFLALSLCVERVIQSNNNLPKISGFSS